MNLLDPDVGDCIDRITILELKVVHGGPKPHWLQERDALYAKLGEQLFNKEWLQIVVRLGAVNALIWDITAKMHLATITAEEYGRLSFQWNNQRAELISVLNAALGRGKAEEKVIG